MFPPDFTPIEYRGMSIITGLVLFFAGVGFTLTIAMLKKEIKDIDDKVNGIVLQIKELIKITNERIDKHSEKLEQVKENVNDLKTNTALLLQSNKRIERYLDNLNEQKTYNP